MENTDDARTLISKYNSQQERVYANYANQMKQLALTARKEAMATPLLKKNPEYYDICRDNWELEKASEILPKETLDELMNAVLNVETTSTKTK